jgi:hypothetical protein
MCAMAKAQQAVEVDGRELSVTNLDKVMYPSTGFTKGEVIDYYARIADTIIPHLKGRPLTLKRYPEGAQAGHFFEKRCPKHRPEWVATASIWSEREDDWSQNTESKTTVAVYSLRARERPTVSTPLEWEEVEAAAESGDPRADPVRGATGHRARLRARRPVRAGAGTQAAVARFEGAAEGVSPALRPGDASLEGHPHAIRVALTGSATAAMDRLAPGAR